MGLQRILNVSFSVVPVWVNMRLQHKLTSTGTTENWDQSLVQLYCNTPVLTLAQSNFSFASLSYNFCS